ncbi:MAG: sugar phosphate isomerase/epimerase [Acidobacteriota bacterium]|nr:MAG: sugar phosphate isomerase/epimerase [Acidobacteriota bacterium]
MNNPIWVMTSAFKDLSLDQIIDRVKEINSQGIEICVFRRDGTRKDHVATHLDYEEFGLEDARKVLDRCSSEGIRISVGAYDNLIGGEPGERIHNQNHILRLIRIAHLLGGNANSIAVGTFVGYDAELGAQDGGFERNLELYQQVFSKIVKYAEDLGVTVVYENCPMEGWRPATSPTTYNNLPGTLAARKLMYTLIPSKAHGETYDPSHDVWQNIDPVDVIEASDMSRIHRVHVKGTRNLKSAARVHWGALYAMQSVNPELARKAGVPIPAHEWDRHHYEPMLPGFGGNDSMDWRAFLKTLMKKGFDGPFVIENEADNSAHTGNLGATVQGFQAAVLCLAPVVWPMVDTVGYQFDRSSLAPLTAPPSKDVPVVTMGDL